MRERHFGVTWVTFQQAVSGPIRVGSCYDRPHVGNIWRRPEIAEHFTECNATNPASDLSEAKAA
jgi:hypothetical protein